LKSDQLCFHLWQRQGISGAVLINVDGMVPVMQNDSMRMLTLLLYFEDRTNF